MYYFLHWSLIDVGAFVRTFQLSLNFYHPSPAHMCALQCMCVCGKKQSPENGKQGKSCSFRWIYMASHLQINWMLNFNNFAYFLAQTKLFLIHFDGRSRERVSLLLITHLVECENFPSSRFMWVVLSKNIPPRTSVKCAKSWLKNFYCLEAIKVCSSGHQTDCITIIPQL